jgi:hypothetical protein
LGYTGVISRQKDGWGILATYPNTSSKKLFLVQHLLPPPMTLDALLAAFAGKAQKAHRLDRTQLPNQGINPFLYCRFLVKIPFRFHCKSSSVQKKHRADRFRSKSDPEEELIVERPVPIVLRESTKSQIVT